MSAGAGFCAACGAAVDPAARFCARCGSAVDGTASAEASSRPADGAEGDGAGDAAPGTLSLEQRRDILQTELRRYTQVGYRVVAQTDTTAQLVKPKTFSCLIAGVLLVFTIGLFFILYLLWYLAQKDEQVYLEIDEGGHVVWNGLRLQVGTEGRPIAAVPQGNRLVCLACGHANSRNRQTCKRCRAELAGR